MPTGTDRAWIVSLSVGAQRALLLGCGPLERVAGHRVHRPSRAAAPRPAPERRALETFDERRDTYEGWEKFNRHYWLEHYEDFLEFFISQVFTEPHSTKHIEDSVGWGLETSRRRCRETRAPALDAHAVRRLAAASAAPLVVIHGSEDADPVAGVGRGAGRAPHAEFASFEGSGHNPHARDPVEVNLIVRDFIEQRRPTSAWTRAIGTAAHARSTSPRRSAWATRQRDVAIARELRKLHPDLEIDWLAQDPVTRVLEAEGERIHPASAELASESGHIESESAEHDLHCFQAWRRMDEILVNNFMVFHDVVEAKPYDLWIGDEAWEIDYFLHENPELKRAAYCWLTDFVGWLPMPDGGEREAFLTADYNAEMVEHIERFPRLRDRAIFVGNPDDIVPDRLGPDLPLIREWTEQHFDFAGYVTGFDPRSVRRPRGASRRARLWRARAGLHRQRRRIRRRRASAPPRDRCPPAGRRTGSRASHDRRRRAADRSELVAAPRQGWRSSATSTTSTATWPRATSRWSRAG